MWPQLSKGGKVPPSACDAPLPVCIDLDADEAYDLPKELPAKPLIIKQQLAEDPPETPSTAVPASSTPLLTLLAQAESSSPTTDNQDSQIPATQRSEADGDSEFGDGRAPLELAVSAPGLRPTPSWLTEIHGVEVDDSVGEDAIKIKAERVSDILRSNVPYDPLLQSAPRPSSISADADQESQQEKLYKAAKQQGESNPGKAPFESRNNRLAREWDRTMKEDLALARRYAAAPKTHAAQAAIKLEWVSGLYEKAKKKRIAEQIVETSDACEGEYLNFAQLCQKLGGGKIGFQAGRNYLEQAQLAAGRNETHNNRPYIAWDCWQKMVLILHMSTTFKDSSATRKTLRREQLAIEEPKEPAPHDGALTHEEPVTTVAMPAAAKASARGKAKSGKSGSSKPPPAAVTDAAADQKKQATACVTWCENLRTQLAATMLDSGDLLSAVNSDPAWEWARTNASLDKLRAGRAALDQLKVSSGFWKEWNVQGYWSKWVRKNFDDGAIVNIVEGSRQSWTAAIEDVKAQTARLQSRHKAGIDPPKEQRPTKRSKLER